jgi:hypothetical protein
MTPASSRLRVEWAACAIAAAASRFIPVPLLDDAVKGRATQVAVVRTLRAEGRTYPAAAVAPLYEGVDTFMGGAWRYTRSIPRRVVLFPVRKYVALFGAVKGVPTDVMVVLLLARTTQRVAARGGLTGADEEALQQEALLVRKAFDTTVDEMDLRLVAGALKDALSGSRGLARAAVGYARHTFGRDDAASEADTGQGLDPGGEVGQSARRVDQVLDRPDVAKQLEEFDRRLDKRLKA